MSKASNNFILSINACFLMLYFVAAFVSSSTANKRLHSSFCKTTRLVFLIFSALILNSRTKYLRLERHRAEDPWHTGFEKVHTKHITKIQNHRPENIGKSGCDPLVNAVSGQKKENEKGKNDTHKQFRVTNFESFGEVQMKQHILL